MYLLETDFNPNEVRYRSRPQKPYLILQAFLRQERPVMQICFTRYEYKDASSCRATFAKAIKYYRLSDQVEVCSSGRKVYLIRREQEKKE